jgi:hypothetical protein
MPNTRLPHSLQNVFVHQENPRKTKTAQGDGRQDKRAGRTARIASAQPARSAIPLRAQPVDTTTPRSQNPTVDNNRTVQLSIWVKPIVKAEIQRLVDQGHQEQQADNITMSSVAAALLERAVQGHIDMQYGALLAPVFQNLFDRRMAARDNRLALLLVRNYLVAEQNRGLTTYLVGRTPDMTPDILNDILDRTFQDAKKKLTRRSPELAELIREVKSWVIDEEKQEKKGQERRA